MLDLVIAGALVLALVAGIRSGALPQVLGLLGAGAGIVLAISLLPLLSGQLNGLDPELRALAVLVILFMALGIGETIGSAAGNYLRLRMGPGFLDSLDRAGGGLFGLCQALLIVWLVGGLIATSDLPALSAQAQRSVAIRTLDSMLPPPSSLTGDLRRFLNASGLPDLFVGLEPLPAPPVEAPGSTQANAIARAAIASTVEVEASACGFQLTGTGFVVHPGYVVTNAHVIAGGHGIGVSGADGIHDATPVLFDPELDVAVLHVPDLNAPALRFATTVPPRGTVGAALGHPLGGPLTILPAAVTRDYQAVGSDLYGRAGIVRSVLEIQAAIRRGDSGGPFVLADGTVGGVVFAEARNAVNVGYALAAPDVATDVAPAIGRSQAVDTGPCIQ